MVYRPYVNKNNPERTDCSSLGPISRESATNHLHWMCDQILANAQSWHPTKAHRWIGFIQGALWALGFFSIDNLRDHVNELMENFGGDR